MDVVVTVPKTFGLQQWIAEGDPAGEPWSGQEWAFYTGGARPKISPGERVYVVCEGRLRGYAPLVRLDWYVWNGPFGRGAFIRAGDAAAVTIAGPVRGFQGWRYRWWEREHEIPFPDWREA